MELLELWAPVDQRTLLFWVGCRGALQGEARSVQAGLVVWKLEKGKWGLSFSSDGVAHHCTPSKY